LVGIAGHGWMARVALAGRAAGLALFWAAAAWLSKAMCPRWDASGIAAWVVCLAGAELARSYVLTGFPWALIGHVWIGWAPMQMAAAIGPHGLTVLTLCVPAVALILWRRPFALLAGACLCALGYGAAGWRAADREPASDRPIVRLVQPNAPQHLKWHPDHIQTFFARQIGFTAAPAETRPSVIVWPETAVPALLNQADAALDIMAEAAAGTPVVFGIQRRSAAAIHNSLAYMDASGQVAQIYDKHHLVPFGEYIPAFGLLAALPFGAFVEEHGFGYTPGPGPRLLDLGPLGTALPLICYEAVFPQDVNSAPERPGWLLQITNDAWFGRWVGPYQHLAQARLRAVEQGLPMVRVANTGVSAVIDARGRIVAELPLNEAGYLDAALPLPEGPTLYAHTGDWPVAALYAAALLLLFGLGRVKSRLTAP